MSETGRDTGDTCLMPHNPEVVGSNPTPATKAEASSRTENRPLACRLCADLCTEASRFTPGRRERGLRALLSAMANAARSAAEPNDLDREVDESLRTAHEWFGLGGGYQCDAVFHIAFSGDQLAKCSLCGR